MNRRGWTLPELLVGTMVAGLLLGGAVTLLHGAARVTRVLMEREEAQETFRTVWTVLHQEVGAGLPGRDWELEPGTSTALLLRAFRGIALPCNWTAGSQEGVVAWRGHRAPDPSRDSVLVLTGEGLWWAGDLQAIATVSPGVIQDGDGDGRGGGGEEGMEGEVGGGGQGPCAEGSSAPRARWRLGEAPSDVLLLRYFERGRYSLEDGAFRYRRGGEGRQPLTPERVGEGSGFHAREDGGMGVRLELEPGGRMEWWLPTPWSSGGGGEG
jgi:type II secretory pathway pseudopilin PulG